MQKGFKATKIIFYFFIALFLVIQVFPIVWLFISSFRDNLDLSIRPFGMPHNFTLQNYWTVLAKSKTFMYIKNSAIVTAISLTVIVITSAMASFAISKLKFRMSENVFSYFLIGLTIPIQVTLIPLFIMYSNFNIMDTRLSLILPMIAFSLPVSVLLFVNFFKFVPDEIIEAAVIDGTNLVQLFLNIILPLSLNTIVTVIAMNTIFIWNDYVFSLTFINSTELKTITLGLQDFIGSFGLTDWGATFAAICISTCPTLFVYFALNKKVVGGMTLGAVKS